MDLRRWIMSRAKISRVMLVAACLGNMGGVAAQQANDRERMLDIPLASAHADIAFTLTTKSRQSTSCDGSESCPTKSGMAEATGFALQVQRIAGTLQRGAQNLYPDLAQRTPGLVDSRFDIYVVDGDDPGSDSSANGRIVLNAGFGTRRPYDEWIAFVIAREMGHVIARHHEENSSAGIATSVLMNILIPGSSLLKGLLSAGGSEIAAKSKRNVQALEADAIAIDLLEASGFRLRDLYLTLLIEPVLLDQGKWSKYFRDSSDNFLARFRLSEPVVVALNE